MYERTLALLLAVTTAVAPLTGCGKSEPPPPVDDSRTGRGQNSAPDTREAKPGLTGTQKVVLLAGAAALYYMYKHHQSTTAKAGPESQYYLSKNGRVYYRDEEHRAHWVTPPPDGVRVPESEAADYRQFQGYDGSAQGKDLTGLSNDDTQ